MKSLAHGWRGAAFWTREAIARAASAHRRSATVSPAQGALPQAPALPDLVSPTPQA